jgi:hypothetical protein
MKSSAKAAAAARPPEAGPVGDFWLRIYSGAFGAFLGLAIVKFGNPVILDEKIIPPTSLSDAWISPWPTHWANLLLVLIALPGLWLAFTHWRGGLGLRALWILPVAWLGWQVVSATQTVDGALTATTLWQLAGCVVCYFLGALVLSYERGLRWLLIGILAAFAFCLVRAVEQRLVEFPQDRQFLLEGQRTGWTNLPPETFAQMRKEQLIITTNGVDVANPMYLAKLEKGRVNGTLVYPNALAGIVLLLLPLSLVLALNATQRFRSVTRGAVIALTLFLGIAGLFWSGSKSGWLIAMGMGGVWLLRLNWPSRLKWAAVTAIAVVGLTVFAVRFQNYFAAGATSVGARFDYWRAAAQTTREHPLFGTGPGTFQRPYARLKAPESEMARLVHNDYLEQFSDSGVIGGICYVAWIACLLVVLGRRVWRTTDVLPFAIFTGLLGWFVQGFSEFGLYIPALAWTAFCLAGWLLGWGSNQLDSGKTTS